MSPHEWVREEVLAMRAYHVEPSQGLVKLDAMENPYRLPPEVAAELGEHLAGVAINRYPEPSGRRLKDRLREAMALPAGQEILLGNGSDEVIQIISLALARPGAVVLSLEPSFVMYRMSALQAGLRYEGVPLRGDFTLDEEAVLAAVRGHRPALTWIAYPNNPTGNLFDAGAVARILRASPGLVAVDEAYFAFAGGASFLPALQAHRNLVVVRTLSKLGLAGLRVGFAVGAAEWIEQFEKLRPPYNVNVLSAAAAEWLLSRPQVFHEQAARILAERDALEAALDALGVQRYPSAANFVLVRVPDAPGVFEALKARGILVRSLHGSHPLLANCLRLTVGTPDENARMLEALSSILGS